MEKGLCMEEEGVMVTNFFWSYIDELHASRCHQILYKDPQIKVLFRSDQFACLKEDDDIHREQIGINGAKKYSKQVILHLQIAREWLITFVILSSWLSLYVINYKEMVQLE